MIEGWVRVRVGERCRMRIRVRIGVRVEDRSERAIIGFGMRVRVTVRVC